MRRKWIKGSRQRAAAACLVRLAQRAAEAHPVRDPGRPRRALGWWMVCFLVWGVSGAWGGDGVLALQTADPSCPDDSTNIYVDCGNGTVTDNRTGLVWLKSANCLNDVVNWPTAMEFVAGLSDQPATSAAAADDCGLSDGSSPGEWRLPSLAEWEAMIADALGQSGDPDCIASPPTITNDSGLKCWGSDPSSFTGVVSSHYWSSTTWLTNILGAWAANLGIGMGDIGTKNLNAFSVWPVRGGQ